MYVDIVNMAASTCTQLPRRLVCSSHLFLTIIQIALNIFMKFLEDGMQKKVAVMRRRTLRNWHNRSRTCQSGESTQVYLNSLEAANVQTTVSMIHVQHFRPLSLAQVNMMMSLMREIFLASVDIRCVSKNLVQCPVSDIE